MINSDPKERIVAAALTLFGENGYKSTTIREICKKAGVSLALVNYHFRNKQSLYEHIITEAINRSFNDNPESSFISEKMSSEDMLKNFIRMLMHRLYGPSGLGISQASVNIIAMEMTNPTEIMDKIYNGYLMGMINRLSSILQDLLGNIDKEDIMRFASSIAGQCLHPMLAREILSRSGFTLENSNDAIEKHAEHIYKFSLNGIKGYKGGTR